MNSRRAFRIIIESGAIYTVSLLMLLVLHFCSGNAIYVWSSSVSAVPQDIACTFTNLIPHRLCRLWYVFRIKPPRDINTLFIQGIGFI